MGADMLVACFSEPCKGRFRPRWNEAKKAVKAAAVNWAKNGLPNALDHMEVDEACNHVIGCLDQLKEAYNGGCGSRELVYLEYPPHRVWLTGGVSWGDSPSEIYDVIYDLCGSGFLEAAGFNKIPDYQAMLTSILTVKKVLPALLGLDKDLDTLIALALAQRGR